jgi:hypothetical protein
VDHVAHFWCVRGSKRRHTIFLGRVASCGFHKKHVGAHYVELVFLHPVGSMGHIVYSSAFEVQNVDVPRDTELVVLHAVGAEGHVMLSSAAGPQNIDTLFFMLGWDRYSSTKSALGHITPNMCFFIRLNMLVTWGIPVRTDREVSMHYFSCSGGIVTDFIKCTLQHVMPNLCFLSSGICKSHSAFGAFVVRNVDALFFMLGWA